MEVLVGYTIWIRANSKWHSDLWEVSWTHMGDDDDPHPAAGLVHLNDEARSWLVVALVIVNCNIHFEK